MPYRRARTAIWSRQLTSRSTQTPHSIPIILLPIPAMLMRCRLVPAQVVRVEPVAPPARRGTGGREEPQAARARVALRVPGTVHRERAATPDAAGAVERAARAAAQGAPAALAQEARPAQVVQRAEPEQVGPASSA